MTEYDLIRCGNCGRDICDDHLDEFGNLLCPICGHETTAIQLAMHYLHQQMKQYKHAVAFKAETEIRAHIIRETAGVLVTPVDLIEKIMEMIE